MSIWLDDSSGKTVAFGVPAIQHILSLASTNPLKKSSKAPISVLVVAPTRELAMQTHTNLLAISSALPGVSSICIYGGVSKDEQKKALREGPRIVVGTPGRLLDLAGEGVLVLNSVSWLVLDEADRMLDRGFENDIREIIKLCLPLPESPLAAISAAGLTEAPTARMVRSLSRFVLSQVPVANRKSWVSSPDLHVFRHLACLRAQARRRLYAPAHQNHSRSGRIDSQLPRGADCCCSC